MHIDVLAPHQKVTPIGVCHLLQQIEIVVEWINLQNPVVEPIVFNIRCGAMTPRLLLYKTIQQTGSVWLKQYLVRYQTALTRRKPCQNVR